MITNFDIDSDSSQRKFVPFSCEHLLLHFLPRCNFKKLNSSGDFEYSIIIKIYYEFKDFESANDNQWVCSSGVIDV
jgi:hypothetical protein